MIDTNVLIILSKTQSDTSLYLVNLDNSNISPYMINNTTSENLTPSSISWSSSINGKFSSQNNISYASLSSGNHTITISVDYQNTTYTKEKSITINAVQPEVIVTSPSNNSIFDFNQIITFTYTFKNKSTSGNSTLIFSTNSLLVSGSGPSNWRYKNTKSNKPLCKTTN